MQSLDPTLLALLACPLCKGPLVDEAAHARLTCSSCSRSYPIKDSIPDLTA